MKTKIKLDIKGVMHELGPDCLINWDEVLCTYKRSDYSGIVRAFTSSFQFFGTAYNLLLAEYLSDRYMADVKVSIWTMNNDWTYTKQFECPLDFSTVEIENGIFTISAVDNSVAALLKANKGVKYEMLVGGDIVQDGTFHFDRLPMTNSVTYVFSKGRSEEGESAISVDLRQNVDNVLWLGTVGEEINVNGSISYNEDQEGEEDSYMLKAEKAVEVKLSSYLAIDMTQSSFGAVDIYVQQVNPAGGIANSVKMCKLGGKDFTFVGEFATEEDLLHAHPEHTGSPVQGDDDYIAVVDGEVWTYGHYDGVNTTWANSHIEKEDSDILNSVQRLDATFTLGEGDILRAVAAWEGDVGLVTARILSSSIKFQWNGRGEICDIPAFKPTTIIDGLMRKICEGSYNIVCRISDHDPRVAKTILMAAESVRAIPGAKFYSSLTEFCDWMETVFGYTYYLGESWESGLTGTTQSCGGTVGNPYTESEGTPPTNFTVYDIKYNTELGKFMLDKGGHWYTWEGSETYNNPDTDSPWTDRLYFWGGKYYFFKGDSITPIEYNANPFDKDKPFQEVVFVHRSELFSQDAGVKVINFANEVRHTTNSSQIYSTVEIGYEEKDYDNINGRDEFNFSNTYTTGCSVSDKKLSLKSKYRADAYGLEFAAQKRDADTTDTDSDSDVFFVYADIQGRDFSPNRTATITGALSNAVFNGVFSPIHCVMANAGYIGMQADELTLKFASAEGNSSIVIDGLAMSGNITLNTPLLTCGELEFVTDDDQLPSMDDMVQVEKNGLRYIGFIKEVEERFAREESVKYQLLIKSIEIC